MSTSRRDQFVRRWQGRAEEYGRLGAFVRAEELCAKFLAELEALWVDEMGETVGLEEAARISGYSEDHLRRLVRGTKLPAARHGRALVFRVADLPRKSSASVVAETMTLYDAVADARRVAARRT